MSDLDGPLNINHWKDEADDSRMKRNQYWATLHKIRSKCIPRGIKLDDYLIATYGIKIIYNQNGDILAEYEIVDEARYLIFLLKYQ